MPEDRFMVCRVGVREGVDDLAVAAALLVGIGLDAKDGVGQKVLEWLISPSFPVGEVLVSG